MEKPQGAGQAQAAAAGRLRALPVQIVITERGVVLRRGYTRLSVEGEGALEAVETIFDRARDGAQAATILEAIEPEMRETASHLLERLVALRLLLPESAEGGKTADSLERASDVFYWQHGLKPEEVHARLAATRIAVVGCNRIGSRMRDTLTELGFRQVELIDHPLLRNLEMIEEGDCGGGNGQAPADALDSEAWAAVEPEFDLLVVTSDFGGLSLIREWNEFALAAELRLLPVVLQDGVGFIGPLVQPGAGPCYECFLRRQDSHLEERELMRRTEMAAFFGQIVDGLLPPAASIVADFAALELLRHVTGLTPGGLVGHLLEVAPMEPALERRRLLRVPRCPACSGLRAHPARTSRRSVRMPGNEP